MRFFIFVLLLFTTSPVFAAGCYSPDEAEAEQGLRIQSELMVIGLNCRHIGLRDGKDLYQGYRDFSAAHDGLFKGYEETLVTYFKKSGVETPEEAIRTLRTSLANDISYKAAAMRPDAFCAQFAPRIEKAGMMDEPTIKKWAATIHPGHPVSRPLCAG